MKIKPRVPNLTDITELYLILRKYILKDMTYSQMTYALYKADQAKFGRAFEITFGRPPKDPQAEFVNRLLLQNGLPKTKVLEYAAIMRSKNGN